MIYQLVNKRTDILSTATSHIALLWNLYNHVFALLISMPRFNSINFYQNRPKIKIFLPKKYKIFERWGSALRPPSSGGWGFHLQTPNCLRRWGTLPPDPATVPPNFRFLATFLYHIMIITSP